MFGLLSRPGRRGPRNPRRNSLKLEHLERRDVPFTATVAMSNNGLELLITGKPTADNITVVGYGLSPAGGGDQIQVTGDGADLTFANISQVFVQTGLGDDTFAFMGTFDAVNYVQVNSGEDNDKVSFADFGFTSLKPAPLGTRINVTTGNGEDLFSFRPIVNPPARFKQLSLTANTGAGNDSVQIPDLSFDASDAAHASHISIDTGSGDDDVAIPGWMGGVYCWADVAIHTGAGDDQVAIQDWSFAGNANDPSQMQIAIDTSGGDDVVLQDHDNFQNCALRVDTGTGNDMAYTSGGSWHGTAIMSFSLGTGDDVLSMQDDIFDQAAQITVDAGSGADVVDIKGNCRMHDAFKATLAMGAGEDVARFMDDTFDGPAQFTIDAGAGQDEVSFNCNALHDAFNVNVALGAGDDIADFTEPMVDGPTQLMLDAGAGQDVVSFADASWAGPITMNLNLGSGDDEMTTTTSTFSQSAMIMIDGNAGDDQLSMTADFLNANTIPPIVLLRGGAGNDILKLFVTANGQLPLAGTFTIDGGAGQDHGLASPFVKVVGCEV